MEHLITYLVCRDLATNTNKHYLVSVGTNTFVRKPWSVFTAWGRFGPSYQGQDEEHFATKQLAEHRYTQIVKGKLKKGYLVCDVSKAPQTSPTPSTTQDDLKELQEIAKRVADAAAKSKEKAAARALSAVEKDAEERRTKARWNI